MKKNKVKSFLVLGFVMGLGVLYGCDNDSVDYGINQNVYSSYEQCMQDWGSSVQDAKQNGFDDLCQPSTTVVDNSTTNTTIIGTGSSSVHSVYYSGPRYYTLPNGTVRTFYSQGGKTFIGNSSSKAPSAGKVVDTHQTYTDTHANSNNNTHPNSNLNKNNSNGSTNSAANVNDANKVSQVNKNQIGTMIKNSSVNVSTTKSAGFEAVESSSIHASNSSLSHSLFSGEHDSSGRTSTVKSSSGRSTVSRSGFSSHGVGHASAGG